MLPFQIIDAHFHLWDPERLTYPWLDEYPTLKRRFGTDDLTTALGSVMFEGGIVVQADCDPKQSADEVAWISSLAESYSGVEGIVAHAALEKGRDVVSDLDEIKKNPLVKGVRRLLQDEDPDFMLQDSFVVGVQALAGADLSFDLCVRHSQLPQTIELVKKCPDVRFVLDHGGKPDIKNQLRDPWMDHIHELAQSSNVWCKLSGLVTEADHETWKPFRLKPYIDRILECFDYERTMFGSDWPVATLASNYTQWIDALMWAIDGCRESQMMRLFRNSAREFYRI